jgi:hypothetical protein
LHAPATARALAGDGSLQRGEPERYCAVAGVWRALATPRRVNKENAWRQAVDAIVSVTGARGGRTDGRAGSEKTVRRRIRVCVGGWARARDPAARARVGAALCEQRAGDV